MSRYFSKLRRRFLRFLHDPPRRAGIGVRIRRYRSRDGGWTRQARAVRRARGFHNGGQKNPLAGKAISPPRRTRRRSFAVCGPAAQMPAWKFRKDGPVVPTSDTEDRLCEYLRLWGSLPIRSALFDLNVRDAAEDLAAIGSGRRHRPGLNVVFDVGIAAV